MRRLTPALYATAIIAAAPGALAAPSTPIGSAVSVVNLVTAELSTERRNLSTGDGVHQNELVEAANNARSEFKLLDDSKLALGPGARLMLDTFVYDAEKNAGSISVRMTTGAFRWITGKAEKKSYTISVPSAAITVRGTIFDTYVQPSGTTWVLLHEGAIQACNTRGKCRVLDEPGQLLVINQDGDVGVPFRWASLKGAAPFNFDDAFPFVVTPPSFESAPVLTKEAILKAIEPVKPIRKTEKVNQGETARKTSVTSVETKPKLVTPIKVVKVKKPKTPIADDVAGDTVKPPKYVVKNPKVKVGNVKPPKPRDDDDDDDDDNSTSTSEGRKWRDVGLDIASRYTTKVRRPKTEANEYKKETITPSSATFGGNAMRYKKMPKAGLSGGSPG